MPDPVLFISLSLALLLTPGPTNTVLAVAGATSGLRSSLRLMLAELAGYMLAIHILAYGIGPFVHVLPVAQTVIRFVCALYLAGLSVRLWLADAPLIPREVITPWRVFTVTLLNPKALVFAFIILPPLPGGWFSLTPWLTVLCLLMASASLLWIGFGAAIRRGYVVRVSPQMIRKAGAVALLVFAVLIATSHVAISAAG